MTQVPPCSVYGYFMPKKYQVGTYQQYILIIAQYKQQLVTMSEHTLLPEFP